MAGFDYPKHHARAFYAIKDVGNVKKGQLMWAHSELDEQRCREAGFTSVNYVKSDWPISMFNKETGDTLAVGKLEWDKEKNLAEVKRMEANGWTKDHVEVPAAKPKKEAGDSGDSSAVLLALGELMGKLKSIEEGQAETDEAILALAARIDKIEKRPVPNGKPAVPAKPAPEAAS